MKKQSGNKHVTVLQSEIAKSQGITSFCDEPDLALDIKWLLKDFYNATIAENGSCFLIKFSNGEAFRLQITKTSAAHSVD